MKYTTVWTPKRFSDFVTVFAVNDGGKRIQEFDNQSEAVSCAWNLNNGCMGYGYYCVLIEE